MFSFLIKDTLKEEEKLIHRTNKKFIAFLSIFTFLFIVSQTDTTQAEVITIPWEESINVKTDKVWTVKFNKPVDPSSIDSNSIFILDESGTKKASSLSLASGNMHILVSPPTEGYSYGSSYTLHITNKIKDTEGKTLSKYVQKKFTIEKPVTYDVVNLQQDGTTTLVKSYYTYAEAVNNLKSNQAIQYNSTLLKIPGGMVVTKAASGSSLTIIYADKQLTKEITYVSSDTELLYLDSTDTYVEVNVAGTSRFIKQVNSNLIPWSALKGRSYYSISNGNLVHSLYSHTTRTYAAYQVGSAPEFMIPGQLYYSVDGANFTDASGQAIGSNYPYFQFLSARTKTNYTAEEIDAYIVSILQELEMKNPNNKLYQQASQKSKLIGLGTFLKKTEQKYSINALFILALAQHESAYGLSNRALQYNNLFGLYVTDNNPQAKYFDSVEKNIEELINAFLNKNYIPPNAAYANGAVFGNKSIGFNVKYASDPYWGAIAAGHLYRIDKAMGGKDSIQPHKLGITTTSGLNVRTGPGSTHPVAYRYTKSNLPIVILDNNLPETDWVKVLSDSASYAELYIHKDYIQELPVK